jgi:hypothetical protein
LSAKSNATGVFRRWWQIEPIQPARWEMILMRILFALVIWRCFPDVVHYDEQPHPNGIAHWVNLTFLADPQVMKPLVWSFRAAIVCYALGVGITLSLGWMLVFSTMVQTLLNSQGAIGHTSQIVSLAILAQLAAWSWALASKWRGATWANRLEIERLGVNWTMQMIVAAYVISALTKLVKSEGRWILDTPYFGLQIIKANDMDYYNTLEPVSGSSMDWLAGWVMNSPAAAMVFIGSGLILELFCFVGLFNRRLACVTGLILILFHSTVSVMMELDFIFNEYLLAIYFVNVPYWLWRAGSKIFSKPEAEAYDTKTRVAHSAP